MRFSIAAVLALASSVVAQTPGFAVVSKPTKNEEIKAGAPYVIEWAPNAEFEGGAISIELIGGPSQPKQVTLLTIAESLDQAEGSFTWEVPATLGTHKIYGIQINLLDSDPKVFQWSNPFHILPTGDSNSSASSSATTSASTTLTTKSSTKTGTVPTSSAESSASSDVSSAPTGSTTILPSTTIVTSTTAGSSGSIAPSGTTGSSPSSPVPTGGAGSFAASGLTIAAGLFVAALAA